jgi:hypothetical protein
MSATWAGHGLTGAGGSLRTLAGIDFGVPEQQQSLIVDNRSISGTANEGG